MTNPGAGYGLKAVQVRKAVLYSLPDVIAMLDRMQDENTADAATWIGPALLRWWGRE